MPLKKLLEKELIENSGFRDSVILRFSENNYFTAALRDRQLIKLEGNYNLNKIFNKRNLSSLKSFNHKKISESDILSRLYSKAINNYELFTSGKKKAREVFDYKSFAKFYAVVDLFETWHPRTWHNLRYYFNPITGKFIPIGFDASKPYDNSSLIPSFDNDYSDTRVNDLDLFDDPFFRKRICKSC